MLPLKSVQTQMTSKVSWSLVSGCLIMASLHVQCCAADQVPVNIYNYGGSSAGDCATDESLRARVQRLESLVRTQTVDIQNLKAGQPHDQHQASTLRGKTTHIMMLVLNYFICMHAISCITQFIIIAKSI